MRDYPYSTAILLFICLLWSSGCSTVAYSGIPNVGSIPTGVTRQELHDQFGTPVSSMTAESRRHVEVFRIRRQLADREQILVDDIACIPLFGYCMFAAPFMFIHTVWKSEANKIDVAAVYDSDDRALYYYILSDEPATRYIEATSSLPHPVLNASALEKCMSVTACIAGYVTEMHLRALETGYKLDADSEASFQRQIEIAHDVDSHQIAHEDAIQEFSKLQTSR